MALGDGKVRFVSENADLNTLVAAARVQDGVPLGQW